MLRVLFSIRMIDGFETKESQVYLHNYTVISFICAFLLFISRMEFIELKQIFRSLKIFNIAHNQTN
jgi:hypothetical protein